MRTGLAATTPSTRSADRIIRSPTSGGPRTGTWRSSSGSLERGASKWAPSSRTSSRSIRRPTHIGRFSARRRAVLPCCCATTRRPIRLRPRSSRRGAVSRLHHGRMAAGTCASRSSVRATLRAGSTCRSSTARRDCNCARCARRAARAA